MPVGSTFWNAEGMLHGEIENIGGPAGRGITGYRLRVRNQFFHGSHPLGWIRKIDVAMDGEPVAAEHLFLVVRHQWISVREVPTICDVWWRIGETAFLYVMSSGGLPLGDHDVALELTVTTLGHVPVVDWMGLYPTAGLTLNARLPVAAGVSRERGFDV
jgi:hypothetical protein